MSGMPNASATPGIDDLALDHVEAEPQRRGPPARRLPALAAELHGVGQRRVGERQGARARHGARHVGDAVVQDAVHHVGRVLVGGGPDRLDAAALVHGHVHDHRARLHPREVGAPDQVGCLRARHQHGADHEVGAADGVEEVVAVGVRRCRRSRGARRRGSAGGRGRRRGSRRARRGPPPSWRRCTPTTPPPMITTSPGATPGTPPSRMPLPPNTFSRYLAPSCTAIRPATSDIGVSSGSSPPGSWTVS